MRGVDRTILLSGMMGSGKSAVGRRLADRLGWRFVDTDEEIASVAGMSIPEVFRRQGEGRFREMERSVLERIPDRGAVVALGGGAIVDPSNREVLQRKGTLALLEARPETLAARVGDGVDRPLLAGTSPKERIARLGEILWKRREAHDDVALRVPTDGRSVDEVCDALLRALCRGETV